MNTARRARKEGRKEGRRKGNQDAVREKERRRGCTGTGKRKAWESERCDEGG